MKTSQNKHFILVAFVLMIASCSSDESSVNLKDNSDDCQNTAVFDSNFEGTACCIQRKSDLTLDGNIEFEYLTNLSQPNIEWKVTSGDIEIISGKNSEIVTIKLGESFSEGIIRALGKESSDDGLVIQCSEDVTITLY